MLLRDSDSRSERRSNGGQAILEPILMAPDLRSDLVFLVELWGFEPQTSCMPSSGNPSTRVSLCRSPPSRVHSGPPASRPVAVLSCCTTRWPLPHELSARTPTTRTAYRRHLVIEADRPKRARRCGGKSDELDAVRAARQALNSPDSARPRAGDAREALRILLATREHATKTRTATVNTLKALILTAPEELRAQFRGRPTAGQVRAALTPVRSRQRTPQSGTTSGNSLGKCLSNRAEWSL